MDRRQLEYFLAVAEQSSSTRAEAAQVRAVSEGGFGQLSIIRREGRLSPLARPFVDVATGGLTDGAR